MVVKKLSISLEEQLAASAAEQAEAAGPSLSAWLARAVDRELKLSAGRAAVAAYEAEFSAFTAEEIATTDAALDAAAVFGPEDR